MNILQRVLVAGLLGGVAWLPAGRADVVEPLGIRVLILDGQNNHNWRATTPVLCAMLEEVGFDVDVTTVPAEGPEREEFAPTLERYDVVLSNFTDFGGLPAPKHLFDKLTRWVAQGGGFVAVHAATAGMEHLPEYVRMVGLGWGTPQRGNRLTVDESGKVIRTPRGEGRGTGHGPVGQTIDVTVWGNHPRISQIHGSIRPVPGCDGTTGIGDRSRGFVWRRLV